MEGQAQQGPKKGMVGKLLHKGLVPQRACPAPSVVEGGHSDDTVWGTFSFLVLFPSFFLPSCLLSSLLPSLFFLFPFFVSLLSPSPLWLFLSLPTPLLGNLSSPLFLSPSVRQMDPVVKKPKHVHYSPLFSPRDLLRLELLGG